MPYYMYVSLQDDDKIVIFTMDAGTGKLTPKGEVPVAGGPSPLTMSPDRQVLYVGHRTVPGISSFRIDPNTGALTQNGTVAPEAAPTFLSTDRTGRYVLSAYYQGAHAAVHPVGPDGAVGGPPIEWLETAIGAHAMQTDPSNQFAFVPHIDNRGGPNAIFQFKFDPTTGHLRPSTASGGPAAGDGAPPFLFPSQQGPALFLQRAGSSVTGYHFDPANGTLSAFQTISTLPTGYKESNTCSQIQIAPSGQFLYAPNRGHNSIASFSVDASSGRLTAIGHVATEERPSAFSLDPDGPFPVRRRFGDEPTGLVPDQQRYR